MTDATNNSGGAVVFAYTAQSALWNLNNEIYWGYNGKKRTIEDLPKPDFECLVEGEDVKSGCWIFPYSGK